MISSGQRYQSELSLIYSTQASVLKTPRQFFSGPMKQFEKIETGANIKGKRFTRIKTADIIDAIGEGTTS